MVCFWKIWGFNHWCKRCLPFSISSILTSVVYYFLFLIYAFMLLSFSNLPFHGITFKSFFPKKLLHDIANFQLWHAKRDLLMTSSEITFAMSSIFQILMNVSREFLVRSSSINGAINDLTMSLMNVYVKEWCLWVLKLAMYCLR